MHAGDHDVESLQHVVGEIERAVLEDVDLHARQDPEVVPGRGDVGVDRGDLVELLGQPLPVETVGDREAGGVVGLHHVLVAERHRRRRHRLDRGPAVAPRGVQVAVALQRVAVDLAGLGDRHLRLGLDLRQIRRLVAVERLGDHRRRRRPDAVEVGQRVASRPVGEFVRRRAADDVEGASERLGLETLVVGPIEAVDHPQQRLFRRHLDRHRRDRTLAAADAPAVLGGAMA